MASKRLFVGNLNYNTDQETLRSAFSEFGEVRDVKIVTDRETGRARGFAFVEFSSEDDATRATAQLNGTELDGRRIIVNEAEQRKTGGGGGGFRPRDGGGAPPPRDFGGPPSNGGGGGGRSKGRGGSRRGGRDKDSDDRW
jgi:cold-inducible RNA-binding protein